MRWILGAAMVIVACAPGQGERASIVVKVSADGRIDLDGKPGTVNQLLAAVKGRTSEIVEVRADSDAIWTHVQWVLAALGEAGFKQARCVFHGYPSPGTVMSTPWHTIRRAAEWSSSGGATTPTFAMTPGSGTACDGVNGAAPELCAWDLRRAPTLPRPTTASAAS